MANTEAKALVSSENGYRGGKLNEARTVPRRADNEQREHRQTTESMEGNY